METPTGPVHSGQIVNWGEAIPTPAALHWLPVRFHIDFKVLMITFTALLPVRTARITVISRQSN